MDTQQDTRNLHILRALPNSGKTTVGNILAPGYCFAGDDYFYELMAETGLSYREVWDRTQLGAAHKLCQSRVLAAMQDGQPNIAVANTNITPKEMVPYEIMAHQNGYRVFYIVVERGHEGDNEHGVPQPVLDEMLKRWQWVDGRLAKRFK